MGNMAAILAKDLGVKESYQHGPRRVIPSESIEANGAVLKWYQLASED